MMNKARSMVLQNKDKTKNTPPTTTPSTRGSVGGGGSSTPQNQTVQTNTSYNGSFLNIDTGTDYQKLINDAVASGDYNAAAKAEAQRNAKLIYLGQGDQATSNYVSVYDKSPTNNQGGVVYDNNMKSIQDAPDNWSTINVRGAVYSRDADGNIYEQGSPGQFYLIGQGINPNTGEFTFRDREVASQKAYDDWFAGGGNQNVSQDYALRNFIDTEYIDALLSGDVGSYLNSIIERTPTKRPVTPTRSSNDNSFEKNNKPNKEDATVEVTGGEGLDIKKQDIYRDFINRFTGGGRRYVY